GTVSPKNKLSIGLTAIGDAQTLSWDYFGSTNAYAGIKVTGTNDWRSQFDFMVNTAQSDTAPTSVMTIKNTGNVGIGTTSPATKLEVGGSTNNVTFDGYLNCTGFTSDANGLLTCVASDERLKENIAAIATTSALAGINALNPVSFNWRNASMGANQQFGLIAQQVASVFPNLVQMTNPTLLTPSGTLTVNYLGLISPIIRSIQELDARTRQILGPDGILSVVPGVNSQCVTGDTRLRRRRKARVAAGPNADVEEDYDEICIRDVVTGDEVQSLDEATGRVVYSRVNALIDMGEQEVYELVTKSGRRIRTTANHPFLARKAS
ncbi:MAG: tail fiber domain-containing protein, partial [bacterium]|nr:tail fiber domain-containing protein [bacterium]